MPTKRVKGKKKLKSLKAKQTDNMGSKRRLAKFGKTSKKGMKGSSANYITRSQAIKRLQITLKDFRRLCILKGIYPRDPKKKNNGKDKTYYYIKDVMHLAHEPILQKFREFKIFMKKLKRALGRNEISEAKRKNDSRPVYELDHIVKERYPRFADALGDLDDALCLVHLFAVMPAKRGIKASMTTECLRIVREWQNYVCTTRSLTKVFASIKGYYYQAKVMGQTITWLVPHQFTPAMDRSVDVRVMLTFLEFYLVLLKFVNHKLYSDVNIAYPPKINLKLDKAGAQLAAIELKREEDVEEEASNIENQIGSSADSANPEAIIEKKKVLAQQRSSKKRLATLAKHLQQIAATNDNIEEEEEEENSINFEPLEAAFASNELANKIFSEKNAEDIEKHSIFSGLRFFLSREVPNSCLELVIRSHGGVVGWEGEGTPFTVKSDIITHQVMDRPQQGHSYFNREYIQPQWVLDSVNNGILLPVNQYAPGKSLPPHLSPFVNDLDEGYTPDYRKQLDKLKSAFDVQNEILSDDDEDEEDDDEDATAQHEEEYLKDLKDEAIDNNDESGSSSSNSDDEVNHEETKQTRQVTSKKRKKADGSDKKAAQPISKKAKKAEEAKELKELAQSMMGKKAKRLYNRMHHGIGKKADKIRILEEKRDKLNAEKGN